MQTSALATLPSSPAAFSWPIRVYWEDTDGGGIVYYANYLKYFERARTEWLRALGLHQSELETTMGGVFVVGEAHVKYQRPARLDDVLNVRVTLQELGRSAATLEQAAYSTPTQPQESPVLLCTATIRIAWVRQPDLRAARIPSLVHERLQTCLNGASLVES